MPLPNLGSNAGADFAAHHCSPNALADAADARTHDALSDKSSDHHQPNHCSYLCTDYSRADTMANPANGCALLRTHSKAKADAVDTNPSANSTDCSTHSEPHRRAVGIVGH